MPTRAWFSTSIYCKMLQRRGADRLNDELAEECQRLREHDTAGRRWSTRHYPGGYTSYATMAQLHRTSSTFADLAERINRHVRRFADDLDFDLRGRKALMSDCWVNIMPPRVGHSFHLHPLAFISGTYYVRTPRGSSGLKFEDPRLDRFMAAPPRRAQARPRNRTYVTYPAKAGNVILFESWLRHEVTANLTPHERISVSFNYVWT